MGPRGELIQPPLFSLSCNQKNYIDVVFFYCLTFQVITPRSFWYLICVRTILGSWAIGHQSWIMTKKSNLGIIKNGSHWSNSSSEKKFRKQNRLVSLSYKWIGPKFFTLDQILRSYSQKTVFQFIALKKFPQKTQNLLDGCCHLPRFFWFFFLCSLKLYIPRENEWKFCPPIHTLGHSGVWGLIQPPPQATGISTRAATHRVKG